MNHILERKRFQVTLTKTVLILFDKNYQLRLIFVQFFTPGSTNKSVIVIVLEIQPIYMN